MFLWNGIRSLQIKCKKETKGMTGINIVYESGLFCNCD